MTTQRALILRDFKDEGTGETFSKNATPTLPDGQFQNYKAAGLVSAAPPRATSKKPAVKAAVKKPRAAAKAATPPAAAAPAGSGADPA